MKTPLFHFDQIMRHFPEGKVLYEAVKKSHQTFSLSELSEGHCSGFLSRIEEETTRVSNYLMLLYDRFGQNSYVVGPKVQDLFRRTDLRKITPSMILAPVTGFYVALPDCPWRIWGGARTRWHQLSGVYVGFTKSIEKSDLESGLPMAQLRSERCLHFALWGAANEQSLNKTDDALLWYSMNLDEWGRNGSDLESFFEQQAIMIADETSADLWKGCDPFDPSHAMHPALPQAADLDEHRHMLVHVLRTVLNLCLYLNSDEPDVEVKDPREAADRIRKEIAQKKAGGKRKKLERRLENLPKTRIIYVGSFFESLERNPSASNSHETGGIHASPLEHAVRPHWQRYWVGSGDQRKQKWTLKGMYVRGTGAPDRTITKIRE